MSRTTATNGQLNAIRQDIFAMSAASPSYRFFFREKIQRFFMQNKLMLKIVDERMAEFIKKYVVHDEAGSPVTEKKDEEEHYTFKDDKTKEEYTAAVKEFMEGEIHIEM